eukprot:gene24763-29924_t
MSSSAPQEIIPIGAFCSTHGFESADLLVMRLNVVYTRDLLRLKKDYILEKIKSRSQARNIDSMLRKAYEIHGKSYRWDLVRSFDEREKDKRKSGKRGTKEKDVELLPVASRIDDWERNQAPPPPPVVKQSLPPTSDRFARHASSGGGVAGRQSGRWVEPAVTDIPPGHLGAKKTPLPYANTPATPVAEIMGTLVQVLSEEDRQDRTSLGPKPQPPQDATGSLDYGASPNANFPLVPARAAAQGAPGDFGGGKSGSSKTQVLSRTQSNPSMPSLPTGRNGVRNLDEATSIDKLNPNPAIARGQTVEPSASSASNTRPTTPVGRLTPGYTPVAPSRNVKPPVRGSSAGNAEDVTVPSTPDVELFYRTAPQQPYHQHRWQQQPLDLTGEYHEVKVALDMNELHDILHGKHGMAFPQTATPAFDELLARNHRGGPAMENPKAARPENLHTPFAPNTDHLTAQILTDTFARARATQVTADPLRAQQAIYAAESSLTPKTARSGHKPPSELVSTRFTMPAKNDVDVPSAVRPQTAFRQDVHASPAVPAPSRYAPFLDGERRVRGDYIAGPCTSGDDLLDWVRNVREERLKSSQSLHTDVHAAADRVVSVEPVSATLSPVIFTPPTPPSQPASAVDPQPMLAEERDPHRKPVLSFRTLSKAIVPEERNSLVSDDEEDGTSATVQSSDYRAVAGENTPPSNEFAVSGRKQTSRSFRNKRDEADSDDEVAEESEVAALATPSRFPVVQPSLASPSASGLSSATGLSDVARCGMAAERGERWTTPEPRPVSKPVLSRQSNTVLVPEPAQVTPSIPVQPALVLDAEVAAWIASEKLPSELLDRLPAHGVYTLQQVKDMTPEVLGLVTSGLRPLPVKRMQQTVDALREGMTWEQLYRSRTPPSQVAKSPSSQRPSAVHESINSPTAGGIFSATVAPSLMTAERGERLTAPEPTLVTPSIPVQQVLNVDAEVVAWIAREKLSSELLHTLPANGISTLRQVRDMTPEVLGLVTSGLKPLPVKRVQQTVDALREGMTWEQLYRARTPPSRFAKSPAIQRPPAVHESITSPSAGGTFSATDRSDVAGRESTSSFTTEEHSDCSTTLEPVPEPTLESITEAVLESMPVQPALVLDTEVVAWIASEKLPKELLDSLPANGVSTLQQVRDMTPEVLKLVTSGLKPLPVKRVQQTVEALKVGMTWEQHYRSRTPPQSIRTITSATTSSASSVSTVAPSLATLPTPPRYVSPNATGRLGSIAAGAMRGPVSRGQNMQQLTSPHKGLASEEEVDWSYYRENRVLEEAEKSWSISELERAIHQETVIVYYLTDIQANDEEFYQERVLDKIRAVYGDDYEPESKKFISESALEKLVEIKSLHQDRAQRLQALLREKMETGEKDEPSVDDAEESHGPIEMDVQRSSDNKRVSFGGGVTRFTIDAKPGGHSYEVNEVFEMSVEQAEEEKQLRREKKIRDEQRKQDEKLQKNVEEKRMVASGEGWECSGCHTVNTITNDRCKLCKMPSPRFDEAAAARQPVVVLQEERTGQRSTASEKNTKASSVKWVCSRCHTMNGNQRKRCKMDSCKAPRLINHEAPVTGRESPSKKPRPSEQQVMVGATGWQQGTIDGRMTDISDTSTSDSLSYPRGYPSDTTIVGSTANSRSQSIGLTDFLGKIFSNASSSQHCPRCGTSLPISSTCSCAEPQNPLFDTGMW